MKSIFRLSKKALFAAAAVTATFGIGALVQAWGPERPTYTIENPAPHVTFNSITNNPNYGDERKFFDAKNAANQNEGGFSDSNVVVEGQELLLRVYVHNNAADNLNTVPDGEGGFVGVARDAKVRIHLPTATDYALRANAYISASNAAPVEVNDTVDFGSNVKFGVKYVPGSAKMYTNAVPSGMTLADSIVTTGAPIGYDQLNGIVPGCFKYTGIVTIKVKVVKPSIDVQKTVRKATWNAQANKYVATDAFSEEVTVKKGDVVQYQIAVTNTGSGTMNDVIVGDNLPPYVSYIDNTTTMKDSNFPDGDGAPIASNKITKGGINELGAFPAGSQAKFRFFAKVADTFSEGCGVLTLKNVGIAGSEQAGSTVEDTAIVKVDSGKPCQGPQYICESVTVEKIGGRKVRVTLKAPATNGATFKNAIINFGDGSEAKVTNQLVNEHTYTADRNYRITAEAVFTVNGEDKKVTSDACAATVSFSSTPGTPGELPKTGAGSLIGLFAVVTFAAGVAHNVVSRRSSL